MESFLQQKIRAKLHFQGRAFCDVLDNSNNNKGHESSAVLRCDVACTDKWPLLRLRSGTSDNGDGTSVFIFGMCQRTCFWSLLFYNSQVFIYTVRSSRASPVKKEFMYPEQFVPFLPLCVLMAKDLRTEDGRGMGYSLSEIILLSERTVSPFVSLQGTKL